MTTNSMLHVRVDENLKSQATETLAAMGLTLSEAVRVFLTRVVADQQFPFELKVPNEQSRIAIKETEKIINERNARFQTSEEVFDALKK